MFLEADLRELVLEPPGALAHARRHLGQIATPGSQPQRRPDTEEGLAEIVGLYAATAADLMITRYALVTRADEFAHSHDTATALATRAAEVEETLIPVRRESLRAARQEEAELEQRLEAAGIDASSIGPFVADGQAIPVTSDETVAGRAAEQPARKSPVMRLVRLFARRHRERAT